MAAEGATTAISPERRRGLEGKVVLVTGASSGIGREICIDLSRCGCRIVAAARRTDRLRSLCDEINGSGSAAAGSDPPAAVRAMAVEFDVNAKGSVIEESVKKAWEAFGRIDALVNNAGIRGGIHSSLDWSEEEWNRVMTTNLTGLWLVSKHVCKRMRDTKQKGSVINVSSINGLDRGKLPGALAYSVSKTGVNAATRFNLSPVGGNILRDLCNFPRLACAAESPCS